MMMALQVATDLIRLIWHHPIVSCFIVVLFTPPFFPIIKYFSPLLISTALFMLALFTMGPRGTLNNNQPEVDQAWEFRGAAEVKVWEDKSVSYGQGVDEYGERMSKRRRSDGSWMEWVKSIEEFGFAPRNKMKNENGKGSILNDQNVSILQEAAFLHETKPSSSAAMMVEHQSRGTEVALEAAGAGARQESFGKELVPFVAVLPQLEVRHEVHHLRVDPVRIPSKVALATIVEPSLATKTDSIPSEISSTMTFTESENASSTRTVKSESDDSGEDRLMPKSENLETTEVLNNITEPSTKSSMGALIPSSPKEMEDVKEKLEEFILDVSLEGGREKVLPKCDQKLGLKVGSPSFKGLTEGHNNVNNGENVFSSDDDTSSDHEEFSDSDCDSGFDIFPSLQPPKMKLHPPVKLDIQELEKRLGTPLQTSKEQESSSMGKIADTQ